ncbi:DUF2357 domain-containing protein [Haploplasma axanthum]|uniref:Domain of uncharacterized function (DUF2357) n=1 Tax=Haploplasma axanthum TaxID=29552 RepID=A0A449BDX2_HAPAX|nr:DUF2357 domain-containing protein [Haploplasma axanthum]VEU80628.1 Domain of uncharacterised function (DUF2357) [Haploplasma axanthum]
MKRRYDLKLFYDMVINEIDNAELETDFPFYFYQAFDKGEKLVSQTLVTEIKKFDETWIKTVESYFPSIDKITKNLKSNLKYEEEIRIIEKAKKTGSKSIQHLAANTHLIKEVKPNIIPKKILVDNSEIDYAIYENRFVMTLIERLSDFVYQRLNIIKQNIEASQTVKMNIDSKFMFGDEEYKINLDLNKTEKVSKKSEMEANLQLYKRVEYLYRQITNLKKGQFMSILKNAKKVTAPILKTQIILKNTDYRNAYNLWIFLDQYSSLGFELETKTSNKKFTQSYKKHLTQNVLLLFATTLFHEKQTLNSDYTKGNRRKFKSYLTKVSNLDVVKDPRSFSNEHQEMNEYYLNQMKIIFKTQIDKYSSEGKNKRISLKNAINDTLKIVNSIYSSYLGINSENEVFDQLIKPDRKKVMLDESMEKYKLVKALREAKEKDLRETYELELRWQKIVEEKSNDLHLENLELSKKKITKKLEKEVNDFKKYKEKRIDQTKKIKEQAIRKHKDELKDFEEKLKFKYQKQQEKIKKVEQEKLLKIKEKLKKEKMKLKLQEQKKLAKEKDKQATINERKKMKLEEKYNPKG